MQLMRQKSRSYNKKFKIGDIKSNQKFGQLQMMIQHQSILLLSLLMLFFNYLIDKLCIISTIGKILELLK